MKQGIKSIEKLYEELIRQREARQDLSADTSLLTFNSIKGNSVINVNTDNDVLSYYVSDIAHRQLADYLSIPYRYYDRMRFEQPELLDNNINCWLNANPQKRMLRTLDGKLRAFLSDRYRRLDNLELLHHILPVITQMKGCEVISQDITETHLYLKVINKTLKA